MGWTKLGGFVLSLLFGKKGGGGLAAELRKAHEASLKADTDEAKLEAEQKMQLVAMRVEAQTRGAGSRTAKFVRASFALPFAVYVNKIVLYDKVLKLGTTDPLGAFLEGAFLIVLTFYFLDASIKHFRS